MLEGNRFSDPGVAREREHEGTIFQVQRWSIHDGAGIRSTVFMKGCPLRCLWCANPESWSEAVERGFGRRVTVDGLMQELRRDEVFYRESGGGVTFSGGEPFARPAFLRALVAACNAVGYDTAVETSAFFEWKDASDIFDGLDTVFVDLKHMDPVKHERFTGVSNGRILDTIRRILASHGNVVVRVPLIAGVNDDRENIRALCDFLNDAKHDGLRGVEFLPHHALGVPKYARLGLPVPPDLSAPSEERIEMLRAEVRGSGIKIL